LEHSFHSNAFKPAESYPVLGPSALRYVRRKWILDVSRSLQCAGINRHEAEDERALRERSSDPLGLESCAGYREVLSEAKTEDRRGGYSAP